MKTSKSSLSYILCCNLVIFSRRMESKVSFGIKISWAIQKFLFMCSRTRENNKNKVGPVIWDTLQLAISQLLGSCYIELLSAANYTSQTPLFLPEYIKGLFCQFGFIFIHIVRLEFPGPKGPQFQDLSKLLILSLVSRSSFKSPRSSL